MNSRIKQLRKHLGLTQEEFSSKINLSRNFIAQIETGAKTPSDRTISDICREFKINEEWLRTGKGTIEIPRNGKLSQYISELIGSDDDFIQDFIEIYMELDEVSKAALRKVRDEMVKKILEREKK